MPPSLLRRYAPVLALVGFLGIIGLMKWGLRGPGPLEWRDQEGRRPELVKPQDLVSNEVDEQKENHKGETMKEVTVFQWVTMSVAVVGLFLSIWNTWKATQKDKENISVIFNIFKYGPTNELHEINFLPCFNVINNGSVSVEIIESGLFLSKPKEQISFRKLPSFAKKIFPLELDAKRGKNFAFQEDISHLFGKTVRPYVRTSTNKFFMGKKIQLRRPQE